MVPVLRGTQQGMTMAATVKRFDVFCSENRGAGMTDHVGVVSARNEHEAKEIATAEIDCPARCHLWVSECEPAEESADDA